MKYSNLNKSPFLKRHNEEELRKWCERQKENETDERRPIVILMVMYVLFVVGAVVYHLI